MATKPHELHYTVRYTVHLKKIAHGKLARTLVSDHNQFAREKTAKDKN